jgi:predicted glycosyltransferase involved in capsule biosynthesis
MTIVKPAGISVVIPVSSAQYMSYLCNCLASIEKQTSGRASFDVTVTCVYNRQFIEADAPIKPLADLCTKHGATLVFHKHDYPDFPLSLARNVGGRLSTKRIVGFVDADLVLDPETFEKVLELVPYRCGAACVHVHRMPHGPEDPIYQGLRKEVFRKNLSLGKRDNAGKGGCFFIDRNLFLYLRGYDERIWGWGAEDDDMLRRVIKSGNTVAHLLTEGILAMHQNHGHRPGFNSHVEDNRRIMTTSIDPVRNKGGWGGIKE